MSYWPQERPGVLVQSWLCFPHVQCITDYFCSVGWLLWRDGGRRPWRNSANKNWETKILVPRWLVPQARHCQNTTGRLPGIPMLPLDYGRERSCPSRWKRWAPWETSCAAARILPPFLPLSLCTSQTSMTFAQHSEYGQIKEKSKWNPVGTINTASWKLLAVYIYMYVYIIGCITSSISNPK